MNNEDFELVRGSGNVFRDFSAPNADAERLRSILAAQIIKALDEMELEITIQQAADMLNVSRPYLEEFLDNGIIPHRKVGTHRRVLSEDIMRYKNDIKAKRRKVLDELTAHDQKLGLQ